VKQDWPQWLARKHWPCPNALAMPEYRDINNFLAFTMGFLLFEL
jgi:hypothetical protein